MSRPDLHTHSTSSDGILTPLELVSAAAEAGMTTLAISDHDTFAGIDSLDRGTLPMEVIPGVELSLRDMHGLHLLGYGTGAAPELRETVKRLAESRVTRARRMLDKLAGLGMPLDADAMIRQCQGTVGRLHIARAMLAAGYVTTMQEAFDRWIGEDGPAYVAGEDRLSIQEALPLMRRNGFVPVLAHPAELGKNDMTLRMLLESWQAQGLMGVEVYHPSQRGKGFAALDATVRRMGLLVTGGSDFHAAGDKHGALGCMADAWLRRDDDLAALRAAMG